MKYVRWKQTALRVYFLFFNDTATTEIYTLSLHDALPIYARLIFVRPHQLGEIARALVERQRPIGFGEGRACEFLRADRKSTRLNSSHANISYAVFCLKKNTTRTPTDTRILYHVSF